MFWKVAAKLGKIVGALTAITVGVWAYASETNRPLVTDAVTNARLIEIFAPADGKLTQVLAEGMQFLSGDELARTTAPEQPDAVLIEDVNFNTSFDIAMASVDTEYALGTPYEGQSTDIAPFAMMDLLPNEEFKYSTNANIQPVHATETTLLSQTSGVIWHWRGTSDAFFASGESVGYVAECLNLIAVGQAASSQTSAIRVGDPVVFVTQDAEWQGFVQRVVAGVPNLSGQYAIQFPVIASDSSLLFFSLEVPAENSTDCALGVSGQIHYPLNARRSPYQVSAEVTGDVKTIAYEAWSRLRTAARPVFPNQ